MTSNESPAGGMTDTVATPAAIEKARPHLFLKFECAAYGIHISGEASKEAIDFAIAALRVFQKSYFGVEEADDSALATTDKGPDSVVHVDGVPR